MYVNGLPEKDIHEILAGIEIKRAHEEPICQKHCCLEGE